jgi:branched-chain amino acid transport system permease protein
MNFLVSINVLCLIIIGGMGSIPGVFVGALVLIAAPELLREFAEFRYLVYGALLVTMMLTRPEGLWPEERRQLELHEEASYAPAVSTD